MVKPPQAKRNVMPRKWQVVGLISGVLLIVLLFIVVEFKKPSGEQTRPPDVGLNAPRPSVPEPQDSEKPLKTDTRAPVHAAWVPPSGAVASEPREQRRKGPSVADLIEDLRDDDIRYNASSAMYDLKNRLPDDQEAIDALIEALSSDDRQQRQIAGHILARWATRTDLRGNWTFLNVMVDALRGDPPLEEMAYTAETFLSGRGDYAKGLLQSALASENSRQRTYAAFILAVGMHIHDGNRLIVEEILGDPSADWFICRHYLEGALAMCGVQARGSEPRPTDSTDRVPDHVYVIERGDMLSNVAWAYYTEWRMLAVYNCLPDPNRIEPGLEIFIPGTLPVRTVEEFDSMSEDRRPNLDSGGSRGQDHGPNVYEHVLYPGETIEDVARQYGTTTQAIMTLTGIGDPAALRPGDRLLIPIP